MGKKKRVALKSKAGPIIVAALVIGAVILSGLAISQQFVSRKGNVLRDTDTAFSIPTHVGQPAPKFTAVGVDGQPYTLTPGDGRPKAIVFYMGFQ